VFPQIHSFFPSTKLSLQSKHGGKMKKTSTRRRWSPVLLALATIVMWHIIGLTPSVSAQTRSITNDSILASYKNVLKDPMAQEQSILEILKQVKGQKPIALIDGYWAFVYDYEPVFQNEVVQKAIQRDLQAGTHIDRSSPFIVPDYTGPTKGVLFIPHNTNILEGLGLDILAGMFPGLGIGADLGGIMATGCWGDDPWDRDPWPEDEEPWPPDEDDDEDPWGRDPWPEDEEPWPPEDDQQFASGYYMFTSDINKSLAQEIRYLFNLVEDFALMGKSTAVLTSAKLGVQMASLLP
jgi:hypothetical protein